MTSLTTLKRRALRNGAVRRARDTRELATLVRLLSRSTMFDRAVYEQQRGRRFPSDAAAAWDYLVTGSRLGLVAGPLLVPQVTGEGRKAGVAAAAHWAAGRVREGFPRTTAHPLFDLAWYREHYPEATTWPGGPLAHYTQKGRHEGARLGPLDPGGVDLVDLGTTVLRGDRPPLSQPAEAGAPVTVHALVLAQSSVRIALDALPALSDEAAGVDLISVVIHDEASPESWLALAALGVAELRGRHVELERSQGQPAEVLDRLVGSSSAEILLLVTAEVALTATDVGRVLDAVRGDEPAADASTPVVLTIDETIDNAGWVTADDGRLVPALRGYPLADAVRVGSRAVSAVSGELVAVRRRAVASATADVPAVPAVPSGLAAAPHAAAALVARVPAGRVVVVAPARLNHAPSLERVITPAHGLSDDPRRARSVYADPAVERPLRWAIKSPHPAGPRRRSWGDYHFARALAAELETLGHHVAIDPLDSWYRESADHDDVTLTLRGLNRYSPAPHQVNLLWIISHPELLGDGELDDFDRVFAASRSWSRDRTAEGHRVDPLLQCTDARVFRPEAGVPGTGYPLLFVGNSRMSRRPLVEAAAESGLDLAVFGGGWSGRIPAAAIRGEYVDNARLPELYRSAGVVLNDHWPDMAAMGFLSNRLFDLTGAGARWVSDPAVDLTEVFPTARVAADRESLEALMAGLPESFPSEDELWAAADEVRAHHSFAARALELSDAAASLREARRA